MDNESTNTSNRPNTPSSTSGNAKPLTRLSEILVGFNFEEWQAQRTAHREKLKPEYCAQYGLKVLTDEEFNTLEEAKIRLKECAGCNGCYCNKAVAKFHRPTITTQDGRLKIETGLCEVWREVAGKEQCRKAGIPGKYTARTFADYNVTADNERAVKLARWFTADTRDKDLYFYGGAGTGKTFLASLIAREYVLQMKSAVFGDVPQLLNDLKKTFDRKSCDEIQFTSEQILDRYCRCKLLVLDDLGAGQITEWAVGILYRIINNRYNDEKLTVVTSNYGLDELEERLIAKERDGKIVDEFSAKRIVSRLKEMCYKAFLGTADRRR